MESANTQSVTTVPPTPKLRRRLLPRGESLIGFAGLALAATILLSLGAVAF